MYFNHKISNLIFIIFFGTSSWVMSMENHEIAYSDESCKTTFDYELPNEIIGDIFKELIKLLIKDFMAKAENIDPQNIVSLKNLRLTSKLFCALIDVHKKRLLRLALQEQVFDQGILLTTENLNNRLSQILIDECCLEHEKKAALLILAGADPSIKIPWKTNKETKLIIEDFIMIMIAKSGNFTHLLAFLCSYGVNTNRTDSVQGSPLIVATQHEQIEVIKILLKNGVDKLIEHNGLTALDIALIKDNQQIIDLIDPKSFIIKFLYSFVFFLQKLGCRENAYE